MDIREKLSDFRFLKRAGAVLVFIASFIVYALTAEPTVSFWDAGEYIATSAKLQVGHPPGAPLYQMIGAVIAGLAPSADKVAWTINLFSGFASALAVTLLYLTVIELLTYNRKEDEPLSAAEKVALLFSGFTGAFALAFSDTFWFSAVEAEVYAAATFLSALLFWLGIKWTKNFDKPRADRWLILIAFVMGLSFGVHFLALLTIPAIGMLYFFKKYPRPTVKQFIAANIAVVLLLVVIFKVLMPSILKYFSALEIFFTNQIGLPFHTGTLIAGLILAFLFYKLLKKSNEENRPWLERVTLVFLFLLIGFSSWIMLPIRANAGTPINENNPASARELLAYYNREQYGETHLFYGPYYTAYYFGLDKDKPYVDDKPKYEQDTVKKKYVIVNNYKKAKQNLTSRHKGLLPRMWDPGSARNYDRIMGRRPGSKRKPTLLENLQFFFKYQLGYMYWRYFMWNWVGRQDDIQGRMDNHGNWISGIPAVDKMLVGPQENLPPEMKNNPARNTYYFLPLILGLLGLIYHYRKDPYRFYAVLMLFVFTGIGVLFYTNVKPFEPRERDYAVVVSFYAFAIWIGMGVYALYDWLKDYWKPLPVAWLTGILSFLAVPGLLAKENWYDHDRSRKYSARNMAKAYLESVQKGGILFSIGDNDTFPLWYAQEIEGIRDDIKIINTSLLNTDWYIDQMKRKTYNAEGAPIKMPHKKYVYGTREILLYQPMGRDTLDIKEFMNIVLSDKEMTRTSPGSYFINPENNQKIYVYPARYIRVPVNKENVIKYGIMPAKDSAKIVDELILDLKGQDLYKAHLAMLDILNNFDWKRPIYFTGGSFKDADYMWAKPYLQLDGMAYKLVPVRTEPKPGELGRIDTDTMYAHVKKFDWRNSDADIYLDPESRRNAILYRMNLLRLARELLNENKRDKAEEITDLVVEKLPPEKYGYYYSLWDAIELYYRLGKKDKARELARKTVNHYLSYINYYAQMSRSQLRDHMKDLEDNLYKLQAVMQIISKHDPELYAELEKETNRALSPFLNE
ncbi:MAG: DUF2723 domain-containing protein [Chlorobi bacterium]|nr:DUF2723 domain-containing protein [Chlorobiota bacterium]